jgi:hypothetical protein
MRRTREFLGLTQRAGVSQGAVSRFEGCRGLSAPFLAIVRLNVALARGLQALEPSRLTEEAHCDLRYMAFLATPSEASEGREASLTDRPLTREPEREEWMRLYRELSPQQRTTLLQEVRAVDGLRG